MRKRPGRAPADSEAVEDGDDEEVVTEIVGPVPTNVPVGMDIVARPFGEPVILRIAAAYEQATGHRQPPAGFGPLEGEP